MRAFVPLLVVLATLVGCGPSPRPQMPDYAEAESLMGGQRPDEGSLFPADTAKLGNEELDRILGAQVRFAAGARFAALPLSRPWPADGGDGAILAALRETLPPRTGVAELKQIPAILLPRQLSVPALREVAARLQCEGVVVYALSGGYDYRSRPLWLKDTIRVRASLQAALLHVRSGIIPYSDTLDEVLDLKQADGERSGGDLIARAVQQAHLRLISRAGAAIAERLAALGAAPATR